MESHIAGHVEVYFCNLSHRIRIARSGSKLNFKTVRNSMDFAARFTQFRQSVCL